MRLKGHGTVILSFMFLQGAVKTKCLQVLDAAGRSRRPSERGKQREDLKNVQVSCIFPLTSMISHGFGTISESAPNMKDHIEVYRKAQLIHTQKNPG